MALRVFRWLWGDLTREEYKKFGILAGTFTFIIGTYWLMRPLKDGLFMGMVGKLYLPYAKMVSVMFLVPLILLYSKLVDILEKHKLFYIITLFYGSFFILVAYLLTHPTIGVANTTPSKYRILGWAIYLGIESFGSLVVTLFWSFLNSTTDAASAKRGYGLVISGAQLGSITGPEFAKHASIIGMPKLALIIATGIFIITIMVKVFVTTHPETIASNKQEKTKSTGFFEGLRLLCSQPYLLGILGVATLYEVIGTILDYQMKFIADEVYHSTEKVTEFLGLYGQCANILAFLFALVGTSFIIRNFGLRFSLVAFPVTIAAFVTYVWAYPTLWVFFGAMVAIKGLSYALNNPCKEIMYIPTSRDVKFKTKSWIDAFGSRTAKACGSGINASFTNMASLMFYGSVISLGIIGIWILVALYVGTKNNQLVQEGTIVE